MIYVKLFLNFLKIGAVSFGGGYGMISLIRETVILNGWLTEDEFISFVAVSESTPGPLAVNMATFIGSSAGGAAGAFLATLGVVLPSFIIVYIIASLMQNLLKYAPVKSFLNGVRPCIAALILMSALTMSLGTFGISSNLKASLDFTAIIVFIMLIIIDRISHSRLHKSPSPILMILISAAFGIIFSLLENSL